MQNFCQYQNSLHKSSLPIKIISNLTAFIKVLLKLFTFGLILISILSFIGKIFITLVIHEGMGEGVEL